jgi:hypothetical protein
MVLYMFNPSTDGLEGKYTLVTVHTLEDIEAYINYSSNHLFEAYEVSQEEFWVG